MKFKTGQILNCKGWGIYGWLIRFRNQIAYGEESWGHSAIIYADDGDMVWVAEALTKGFTISAYEKWWLEQKIKEGFFILGEGDLKVSPKKMREILGSYEGRPYGWTDILGIVVHWIFGRYAKRLTTNSKSLICSEAVARFLYDASKKKINFEKEFGIRYDLIEPHHIYKSNQINWEEK